MTASVARISATFCVRMTYRAPLLSRKTDDAAPAG